MIEPGDKPYVWVTCSAVHSMLGLNMMLNYDNFSPITYQEHLKIAPIQAWGAVFAIVGLLSLGAWVAGVEMGTQGRRLLRILTVIESTVWFAWAAAFLPLLANGWSGLQPVMAWGTLAVVPQIDLARTVRWR